MGKPDSIVFTKLVCLILFKKKKKIKSLKHPRDPQKKRTCGMIFSHISEITENKTTDTYPLSFGDRISPLIPVPATFACFLATASFLLALGSLTNKKKVSEKLTCAVRWRYWK